MSRVIMDPLRGPRTPALILGMIQYQCTAIITVGVNSKFEIIMLCQCNNQQAL